MVFHEHERKCAGDGVGASEVVAMWFFYGHHKEFVNYCLSGSEMVAAGWLFANIAKNALVMVSVYREWQ